ncbi:MAG: hypothetical protein L6R41_008490 [Letrouitia leprolyta]|nr:MAG: hypothetical protein L6R41_008490 [Letrouitia leprolyta]
MASSRVSISLKHCAARRIFILDAFTSLSSTRARPPLVYNVDKFRIRSSCPQRCFSTASQSKSELVGWKSPIADSESVPKDLESLSNDGGTAENSEPLPWYLQVQTPRQEMKSLSDRQRLPALPPDPPPLLQPMLEHISIDLGLDDLSLLDLREVDPPPALGANLMMIIGTARSEKHLHVSADRFCRWLRHTHRLTPYPDGLLGRGELRLKLKRKNRRARMLNSIGASDSSNTDDGIRTGWVCVNIGIIEDGRVADRENTNEEDKDYIGFGGESSGVRVVVQMLTEEKREELDLETWWGQALGRHTRRRDRIAKAQEPNPPPSEFGQTSMESYDVDSTPLPVT